MDVFIGTILPWSIKRVPNNWALCQGQQLQISQYQALYSLIGTTYGGDGKTYFNLPDLRGRVLVGAGTPQGTTTQYNVGQTGGTQTNTVAVPVPQHTHTAALTNVNVSASFGVRASTTAGTAPSAPTDAATAANYGVAKLDTSALGVDSNLYKDISSDNTVVKLKSFPCDVTTNGGTVTVNATGTANPTVNVPVMQPYMVVNYIICLQGLYPDLQ
ncbi:MAG: tail fiber protein [Bacillota bacterium]|nr:tail fiber protein [Bacillota bacterium]